MATIVREVLNAAGMQLPIFTGGQSFFGINLSGTWTGKVSFSASTDGVNFQPVSLTPYASGTPVQFANGNGNWFAPVGAYVAFMATFTTLTTGTVTVQLGASVDSSFQRVFLAAASQYINHAASSATNTLSIAASTNRAFRIRKLVISADATPTWASSPALQVLDGATVLWALDPPLTAGSYDVPLPSPDATENTTSGGIVNTPGNSMSVTLASSGGHTNINAEVSPA